jgi:hypothetical protein
VKIIQTLFFETDFFMNKKGINYHLFTKNSILETEKPQKLSLLGKYIKKTKTKKKSKKTHWTGFFYNQCKHSNTQLPIAIPPNTFIGA